ncbi:glycosyltransferase family 9 protein [Oceanibaculum indicum]|uniref:Heptosyltransferase-2 n=1 Tax=Oceanibaculum indicum TaxID=526216 RepID=A0A420WAP3_9PROT|nr:glycosyltransferase family 9 protein [Oceanibaculum indicum]RKQ68058.1 heptosyltransferase-2 [Oceanibaculum indicum]
MADVVAADGKVAIIQPLPGVGDMVWHLPHIHALAKAQPEGAVAVITKPRSRADQLFAADPAVSEVIWLDRAQDGNGGAHDGVLGVLRLARLLRSHHFRRVYVLHHSWRYACAAWLAGIPERFGYGMGRQRRFLNRVPFLPESMRRDHPLDLATAWLKAAGIAEPEQEPLLRLDPAAVARAQAAYADRPRPWIALGLGSSEPYKQWGAERYAALAAALSEAGWGTFFLLGGPDEKPFLPAIRAALGDDPGRLVQSFDMKMGEILAFLGAMDLYVGNDTSFLNLAAASGVPAIGLFGATPPLTHSTAITALLPPDGVPDKADGMARITVEAVMEAVAAHKAKSDG